MKTFRIFFGLNLSLKRWGRDASVWLRRDADGSCLRCFSDDVSFLSSSRRSLTGTLSRLDWRQGKWELYAKDLEMALQSEEARACSERGFFFLEGSRRLSPLFESLWLNNNSLHPHRTASGRGTAFSIYFSLLSDRLYGNQLSSVLDCIGQLTNLTMYNIDLIFIFISQELK